MRLQMRDLLTEHFEPVRRQQSEDTSFVGDAIGENDVVAGDAICGDEEDGLGRCWEGIDVANCGFC